MRVLYVGFDGLGYDVFSRPNFGNFAQLVREGNHGIATPDIRHTFPSWTSINTGLPVRKHGVINEWRPEYGKVAEKFTYIWDHFYEAGFTCGVLNFPVTMPARRWDKEKGWFVAGYPSGFSASSHFPPNLPAPPGYHTDWVDYVRFKWGQRGPAGAPLGGMDTAKEVIAFETLRLDFLKAIKEKHLWPQFLAVQIPAIDRIGHEMCKPMMVGQDQRAPLPKVWTWCDEALGIIVDLHEPDVVLVTSDHGMNVELHTDDGTWALAGPGVKRNARVNIRNHRVMASLLEACGLPVPEGIGRSALVRDEEAAVTERLKALGYVD